MHVSVNDLLCFDYFKSLRLLAGEGGLSNNISSCGILDYEMDQSLNGKYLHSNFRPNQLAITSLLFAKNNPFLIRDAVKYLVSKEGSGLIIKNVFRLHIHESILRYANLKNFPIFLMDDHQMYFEEFIIQVDRCIEAVTNSEIAEEELNRLLYQGMSALEKKTLARRLLPFFHDQYAVLYFNWGHFISESLIQRLSLTADTSFPEDVSKTILRYKKGFFLFLSQDTLSTTMDTLFNFIHPLIDLCPDSSVGISGIHFQLETVDHALQESVYAAKIHHMEKKTQAAVHSPFLHYCSLGIYQALLPVLDNEVLQRYSSRILEPLIEFDAENRSTLMKTLLDLVQCGGDLHLLALQAGQHENTLRYRLEKVCSLTGLNYRKPMHYEELAIAARIYLLLQDDARL